MDNVFDMEMRFFPKDVVSGKCRKQGDKFVAEFFGGKARFVITQHFGDYFMAVAC